MRILGTSVEAIDACEDRKSLGDQKSPKRVGFLWFMCT